MDSGNRQIEAYYLKKFEAHRMTSADAAPDMKYVRAATIFLVLYLITSFAVCVRYAFHVVLSW